MEQKCSKCKEIKQLNNFYKDRCSKNGYQHACKVCQKERNKKYAKKNRDYFKKKGREKYKKKLKENPNFNKERYLKNKNKYLKRRDEAGRSVYGRIYQQFDAARSRSRRKGMKFELDMDFLMNLYQEQNEKCAMTGMDFKFERNSNGERFFTPYAPSIDRIDCSKGYLKSNVRLVTVMVNLSLNKFGDEEFDKMCKARIKMLDKKS